MKTGAQGEPAHCTGPLPALITRLLLPPVHLHPWFWFSFQEPFVKQQSRKWGWCTAVAQARRLCLRDPHFKSARWLFSPPTPPPLSPSSQGRTVCGSSVGGTGAEDRTRIHKVPVIDRDITAHQIYYWPKSRRRKAKWLMRLCDMVKALDLLSFFSFFFKWDWSHLKLVFGGCLIFLSPWKLPFPCYVFSSPSYQTFPGLFYNQSIISAFVCVLVIREMPPLFIMLFI